MGTSWTPWVSKLGLWNSETTLVLPVLLSPLIVPVMAACRPGLGRTDRSAPTKGGPK